MKKPENPLFPNTLYNAIATHSIKWNILHFCKLNRDSLHANWPFINNEWKIQRLHRKYRTHIRCAISSVIFICVLPMYRENRSRYAKLGNRFWKFPSIAGRCISHYETVKLNTKTKDILLFVDLWKDIKT